MKKALSSKRLVQFAASFFCLTLIPWIAAAAPVVTIPPNGAMVSVANPTDMAFDSLRGILYITSGSSVLRYSLVSNTFLPPFNLGGTLFGLDLSPDQNVLAVADSTIMSLDLIYLPTIKVKRIPVPPGPSDVGLYDVAIGSDGMVYASGDLPPGWSGWVSLHKIDPKTGTSSVIGSETVTNYTILRASPDRHAIAICEGNISDGRWGAVNVDTGTVTIRSGYSDGTSYFNYDLAAEFAGSEFAIPTAGGLFIYDHAYVKQYTIAQAFVGVAYSPKNGLLYATLSNSDEIQIYNPRTFQEVGVFHTGLTMPWNSNWQFRNGILRFSHDGTILFVSVPGGIAYYKVA